MHLDSIYLSKSIGLLNPKLPKIVFEETLVSDAIVMLKEDSGGAVLVCSKDEKLLGIFTERDVLKKVVTSKDMLTKNISTCMTTNPISVNMTTPLAHALQLMSEGGFRHIPITDDEGYVLGILSMKDIVDELVRTFVFD